MTEQPSERPGPLPNQSSWDGPANPLADLRAARVRIRAPAGGAVPGSEPPTTTPLDELAEGGDPGRDWGVSVLRGAYASWSRAYDRGEPWVWTDPLCACCGGDGRSGYDFEARLFGDPGRLCDRCLLTYVWPDGIYWPVEFPYDPRLARADAEGRAGSDPDCPF